MTTVTRTPCPVTWPGPPLFWADGTPARAMNHGCDRAADDHPDGLHVCRCGATRRVTEGERP